MRRKLDTAARREQIAQAALDLISEGGLRALSMSNLAGKVDLVPSGIYRHFTGKGELMDAVLDLIGRRLFENTASVREETEDALGRLRLLMRREMELLKKNQGVPNVVFSESMCADSPERAARVGRLVTAYFREIEEIVREGQRKGELRDDVEPLAVVLMFKGILLPAVVLWKATGGTLDIARHSEAAWRLFRDAVTPRREE